MKIGDTFTLADVFPDRPDPATCKHVLMGVWPRTGEPRMVCNKWCGYARPMTINEQKKAGANVTPR